VSAEPLEGSANTSSFAAGDFHDQMQSPQTSSHCTSLHLSYIIMIAEQPSNNGEGVLLEALCP
jgi:hypothetical protein